MIKALKSFIKGIIIKHTHLKIKNNIKLEYYLLRSKIVSDDKKKWEFYSKKHEIIIDYIDKNLSKCRNANTNSENNSFGIEKDFNTYPIWLFWWQGVNNMPEIVKVCYKNMLKYSNEHPVILIDKNNYGEYIVIDEIILNKLGQGLSVTHFSDIIRLKLLSKYGGLWLDSTILLTSDIEVNVWESKLFTIKNIAKDNSCVGEYRWAINCLFVPKNSLFIKNIEAMFSYYWECNNFPLDYLFLDYCFEYELRNNVVFRRLIERQPINNVYYHALRKNLNNKYIKNDYNKWTLNTHFHKLTYKGELRKNIDGTCEKTYYGFLIELDN